MLLANCAHWGTTTLPRILNRCKSSSLGFSQVSHWCMGTEFNGLNGSWKMALMGCRVRSCNQAAGMKAGRLLKRHLHIRAVNKNIAPRTWSILQPRQRRRFSFSAPMPKNTCMLRLGNQEPNELPPTWFELSDCQANVLKGHAAPAKGQQAGAALLPTN